MIEKDELENKLKKAQIRQENVNRAQNQNPGIFPISVIPINV